MKNGKCTFGKNGFRFFKNDKLHREDGHAVEYDSGAKLWYYEGKKHRIDGPAVEIPKNYPFDALKAWYFHGKHISCSSQEEFEKLLRLKAFW
jgi:hypothetical protein